MIFEQHYLDCLSQASYLIADERAGTAVVVDPRRDVQTYLDAAAGHGVRIDLVIETHFHADFVSGHLELAAATGATIAYGPGAVADFPIRELADGERIAVGDVVLEILHTPGHTPESICVVVYERASDDRPYAVLTGDTLFIGDVGRPDLVAGGPASSRTQAAELHRSLHTKLLTLPDDTLVFPGHGAGSACGANLSSERSSTIGEQRLTNTALSAPTRAAFVDAVAGARPAPPRYFAHDAAMNRRDRDLFDAAVPVTPLSPIAALRRAASGAVLVDTREPDEFAAGHLPDAVNVPLSARFAELAGKVLDGDRPVVVVTAPGAEAEARTRLARIGIDRVSGYVEHSWSVEQLRRVDRLEPDELARRLGAQGGPIPLDVREPTETAAGVIPGAVTIPIGELVDRVGALDRSASIVVYCASGVRSSVAASLLRRCGFADVVDLRGGIIAWNRRPEWAGR